MIDERPLSSVFYDVGLDQEVAIITVTIDQPLELRDFEAIDRAPDLAGIIGKDQIPMRLVVLGLAPFTRDAPEEAISTLVSRDVLDAVDGSGNASGGSRSTKALRVFVQPRELPAEV